MRTTLDIDDDLLVIVRSIAVTRKQSIGKVISDLTRKALQAGPARAGKRKGGFPTLQKTGQITATNALVNKLRDEENL
jgi:hypothetical protein